MNALKLPVLDEIIELEEEEQPIELQPLPTNNENWELKTNE